MKAIGLPPSDPRLQQMNDAQWLWCYFNEMEDKKEESDLWKSRFKYLTYFINLEMARSVHEAEEQQQKGSKYKKEDLHKNSAFDLELKAASLGYDPSSGLTVEEFLSQHESNKNKEVDIMNDSFEELLASGEFVEVADHEQGVGNKQETFDDFVSRAMLFEQELIKEDFEQKVGDIPIGIDEKDWEQLNNPQNNNEQEKTEEEKIKEALEMDLDFFEVDDDE